MGMYLVVFHPSYLWCVSALASQVCQENALTAVTVHPAWLPTTLTPCVLLPTTSPPGVSPSPQKQWAKRRCVGRVAGRMTLGPALPRGA